MIPDARRPAVTLADAAAQAPVLGDLLSQARESSQRLEWIRPLIPAGLRAAVHAGPVDGTEWCLVVDGPAAAAKLRQLLPMLLDALRTRGREITAIRLRVQTPGGTG